MFKDEAKSFKRQFKYEVKKQLRPTSRPARGRTGFFDMLMDAFTGAPRRRR